MIDEEEYKKMQEKAAELNFQRAKDANRAFLPKNIENLDEVLKGINRMEWITEGLPFDVWFDKKAKYIS
jgi:hypothetical protein